jgi:hypothetical protein
MFSEEFDEIRSVLPCPLEVFCIRSGESGGAGQAQTPLRFIGQPHGDRGDFESLGNQLAYGAAEIMNVDKRSRSLSQFYPDRAVVIHGPAKMPADEEGQVSAQYR